MSALFYFYKGLKFWECYHALKTICEFEVNPVGAPLGEEVTKHEDFKEAGCKVSVEFPELDESVFGCFGFESISTWDYDPELSRQWNPEGDSLIHRISIGFSDASLTPERIDKWPERMSAALAIYQFYKRVFVTLGCDEAKGMSGKHLYTVFRWNRRVDQQTVIHAYEENRVLTMEEFGQQDWTGTRPIARVFPGLERCRV
ncbi:MAG: hypothetical protein V4662_07260 [Verrucomicrobiota bacterium]